MQNKYSLVDLTKTVNSVNSWEYLDGTYNRIEMIEVYVISWKYFVYMKGRPRIGMQLGRRHIKVSKNPHAEFVKRKDDM